VFRLLDFNQDAFHAALSNVDFHVAYLKVLVQILFPIGSDDAGVHGIGVKVNFTVESVLILVKSRSCVSLG
jgi:hypothetical protein